MVQSLSISSGWGPKGFLNLKIIPHDAKTRRRWSLPQGHETRLKSSEWLFCDVDHSPTTMSAKITHFRLHPSKQDIYLYLHLLNKGPG